MTSHVRLVPLAALVLVSSGCVGLGTNIEGDFTCRAPKGDCATAFRLSTFKSVMKSPRMTEYGALMRRYQSVVPAYGLCLRFLLLSRGFLDHMQGTQS